jgi:hypothetical protein
MLVAERSLHSQTSNTSVEKFRHARININYMIYDKFVRLLATLSKYNGTATFFPKCFHSLQLKQRPQCKILAIALLLFSLASASQKTPVMSQRSTQSCLAA